MGASGDTLFADPLGVRAEKAESSSRPNTTSSRQQAAPVQASQFPGPEEHYDGSRDLAYHEEEGLEASDRNGDDESWGPVSSFLWYLMAGGKQCCSMRDRNRPQDIEAARLAAQTGRPPKKKAPDLMKPPESRTGTGTMDDPFFPDAKASAESAKPPQLRQGWGEPAYDERQDMGTREMARPRAIDTDPQRSSGPDFAPAHTVSPSPSVIEEKPRPIPPKADPPRSLAASRAAAEVRRQERDPPPPDLPLPTSWEFPGWCLNFKTPSIEVYVVDDESGEGRWVSAEPKNRVVDKTGRDAYLHAEYSWDGVFYVQDFGPQHVRKKGMKLTLLQMLAQADFSPDESLDQTKAAPFRKAPEESLDQTKVFAGRGRGAAAAPADGGDLESTKLFQGRKASDKGGGMTAFLAPS